MSLQERTGTRDLTYSRWHRPASVKRFLTAKQAATLTVIDIDWVEACCFCSEPLALIETQCSAGPPKEANITSQLGRRAQIPVYSVSYVKTRDGTDIEFFRSRELVPRRMSVQEHTPRQFAEWLRDMHERHHATCERVK